MTGKVRDWKKAAANDCYVGENFEISVRRTSGDRFTAKDPIGFGGGLNFYSYALSNPINFIDPLGLAIGDFPPAPPGYNSSTWTQGQWSNGKYYLVDPNRNVWTIHPEDNGHWRHWDKQDSDGNDDGSWPPNSGKPWSGQKKLKSNQCDGDPSGDAPPWEPLDSDLPPGDPQEMLPFMPGLTNPPGLPPLRIPIRIPVPVFVP